MATATTASAPRSLLPNELGPIIRLWLRRAEGLAAYGPHMHTDCAFAEVQQDRNLLAMPANIN